MPGLVIRDAAAQDRPVLLEFLAALHDVELAIHPNRRPGLDAAESHLAYLEGLVRDNQGRCLIAETEGRRIGFLICAVVDMVEAFVVDSDRSFGWIAEVYVVADCRGQGVGRALLDAAEAHFRTLDLAQMRVWFLAGNDPARRAYSAAGFRSYETVYEKRLREPE